MVGIATIATVLVAGLASLFMAWAIGAGSSGSTPFAPAVGANAISIMRAGFVVGLLGLGGAVIQGANVSEAVGRELIVGDPLSAQAAALALTIAAALVAIGIFAGYPIATAFTVTGAVVGVGLAMGGDPAWPKYVEIATLWVLVPFVGGGIAYATARFLRSEGTAERLALPTLAAVVGALIANVEIALLGEDGASIAATTGIAIADAAAVAPIAGHLLATAGIAIVFAAALYREMRIDPAQGQRRFLLALGGLVPHENDAILCYLTTEEAGLDAVADAAADSPEVVHVRKIDESGAVEVEIRGSTPLLAVSSLGGTVRRATYEPDGGQLVVDLPPESDVRRIVSTVTSEFDVDVRAKHDRERSVTTAREFRDELADRLTDRQETVLHTAYLADYFESPRGSSAEEVAASLDITGSTLLYHLRAGQRKLLETFFRE